MVSKDPTDSIKSKKFEFDEFISYYLSLLSSMYRLGVISLDEFVLLADHIHFYIQSKENKPI